MTCECGKPADGLYSVWNGMHYLEVCEGCWINPETIVMEACVSFVNGEESLEEYLRVELGFRSLDWTHEIQALCDQRYCEWYLEESAQQA